MKLNNRGESTFRRRQRSSEMVLPEPAPNEYVDLEQEFSPADRELLDQLWERRLKKLDKCPELELGQRFSAVWSLAAACDFRELLDSHAEFKWSPTQQQHFLEEVARCHQLAKQQGYAMHLPMVGVIRGLQTYNLFVPNDGPIHLPQPRGRIDRLLRVPVSKGPAWKLEQDEIEPILTSIEKCILNPESDVLQLGCATEGILFLRVCQPQLKERLLRLSKAVMDIPPPEGDPFSMVQYVMSVVMAFPELKDKFPVDEKDVPQLREWLREILGKLKQDPYELVSSLDVAFRLMVLCMAGAERMGVDDTGRIYFTPRPRGISSSRPLPVRSTI